MASKLDIKRIHLELSSINHGIATTEFRIAEFQDNIDRQKPILESQLQKQAELLEKLKELESNQE